MPRATRKEERQEDEKFRPDGYPSLADWITRHSGAAVYRHFDDLSSRNLLYLQSELLRLQKKQDLYDAEDYGSGQLDAKERARDWDTFHDAASDPSNGAAQARMKLVQEIRSTLKEYKEALVLEPQTLAFRPPTKQTHKALCKRMHHDCHDRPFPLLWGDASTIYDNRRNLIALERSAEEDRLTMVLRKYFPVLFPGNVPREGRIGTYSDTYIRRTVAAISCCVAAGLLYGAILNFYFVREEKAVLGLIAAYTIAFALCVGLLTNAKRSEIFAACSAYAAVIVVFISNPPGNTVGAAPNGSTVCVCPPKG